MGRCTVTDAEGWHAHVPLSWLGRDSMLTGSVLYFGSGEDVDILLDVCDIPQSTARSELARFGWTACDSGYAANDWLALRKGDWNLLCCFSRETYKAKELAAKVCTALALASRLPPDDKDMRVLIHTTIYEGFQNGPR